MLDHILVPLDGSPLAEGALPHLLAVAQAYASRVTLLRVVELEPGPANPWDSEVRKVEAQAYLEQVHERLKGAELAIETVLYEGRPAQSIVEHARAQPPDLLLTSSHGESGPSGWNISSVVQKLIARIGSSIMLVPAYQGERSSDALRYRRILLPLDGSTRAEHVLPFATKLASYHEAELILAHVVIQPEMPHRLPLSHEDQALSDRVVRRNCETILRYFESLQDGLPVKSQAQVRIGRNVVTELHRLILEEAVDLVLLSAHGYSGERWFPYGSVAISFIAYGVAPLLIIQDLPKEAIEATQAEMAMRTGALPPSASGSSAYPNRPSPPHRPTPPPSPD